MGNLGAGNGFQYPIGKIDVSGRESWQTLGTLNSENVNQLSEAEKAASIYESLRYAVFDINFNSPDECTPCFYKYNNTPVRYYNGSTNVKSNFVGHGWERCVWVEYYSETLNVSLCGFEEFTNFLDIEQSTPVKYYKRKESNRDYNYTEYYGAEHCATVPLFIFSGNPKKVWQYDPDCILAIQEDAEYERQYYDSKYVNGVCVSEYENTTTLTHGDFNYGTIVSTTQKDLNVNNQLTGTVVLSEEDTEQAALDRAIEAGPIIDNLRTSIWEVRTYQKEFVKQVSKYRIHLNFLKEDSHYKVTPIIQRRSLVLESGSGPWEEVSVSPYYFTANGDRAKVIDEGGEMIELDHVQGYEYRMWDLTIEEV